MRNFGTISVYPTPESLKSKIDEYFDYCFVLENKYGRSIPKCIVPPTFSGLARYLGFGTRMSLINYVADNGNELYEDIINDAKLRIEDFYEGKLIMSKGPSTGIQFALKNNCGWEDTTKQQLSGPDNRPVVFSWGIDEAQIKPAEVTEDDKKLIEERFEKPAEKPKEEVPAEQENSEPQDLGFTIQF